MCTSHDAGEPNLRRPCQGICGEVGAAQQSPRQTRGLNRVLLCPELIGESSLPAAVLDGKRGQEYRALHPFSTRKREQVRGGVTDGGRVEIRRSDSPQAEVRVAGRDGSPLTTRAPGGSMAAAGFRVTAATFSPFWSSRSTNSRPTFPVAAVTKIMILYPPNTRIYEINIL